jgi:hypothetical protein
MLAVLPLVLLLQVQVRVGVGDPKSRDSTRIRRAAAEAQIEEMSDDTTKRRTPHRVPVTAQHLATAFHDTGARNLLHRARVARLAQDSLLVGYDANTYQRISVGLGFKAFGRDRLLFRHEDASHVRWQRGRGAWVELTGRRTALPVSKEGEREANTEMGDISPIPYYPGREALWVGSGMAKAEVDERQLVHPIAEGAEAYYTYETGDSVIMTLPDGRRITLRELRIAAREPKWNVTVGSFWFDEETAQLVRAVYRLSAPMDIMAVAKSEDPKSMDDVPIWVKPMITPMKVEVSAITVEYGLLNQRFWLPRSQTLDGKAQVSFMRVPVAFEQRFKYNEVNGLDTLPTIAAAVRSPVSILRDSLREAGTPQAMQDSLLRLARRARAKELAAVRERECASTGLHTTVHTRYEGSVRIVSQIPCDSTKLANSRELPGSIYDKNEQLFSTADRDDLMKALSFGLQPGWAPQKPTLEWGLPFTRYNRVEGFSSGLAYKSVLGRGYTAELGARGSLADKQINGDLSISRSNGRATLRGSVYRRLDVMTDFGTPLSFGSSLATLLYARDEGAYYRTWGAELAGTHPKWGTLEWRLFGEQQWKADVNTRWSLFGGANDKRFIENPAAQKATEFGAGLRLHSSVGLDPDGFRLLSEFRAEGAGGDYSYARGLFDATLSHALGNSLAGSVRASAGYSGGTVPVQRLFYLGGLQTVRGQTALTGVGDAFWLTRAELGFGAVGSRFITFGDVGWAGDRRTWSAPGRPLSGVGVGASFLDGLIRVDVARGLYPARQWRMDLYLEAKF